MTICQSCGMPMEQDEHFGSNKDGSKNTDYCVYCFKDGDFIEELTMEQMIAYCAEHIEEWGIPMTKEQAIEQMNEQFPKFKRWAKA